MKFILRIPAIVLFAITLTLLIIPYFDDSVGNTTNIGSLVSVILSGVLVLWYFSIGNILSESQFKKGRFKFNSLYLVFFGFLIISIITLNHNLILEYNKIIVFMTIYSIYALFQILFFCAKCLNNRIDKVERITSKIGYVFLLWFFPIGIWIIQPKLNLIAEDI